MLNFFEPRAIINGKPYKSWKYEEILKEQMLIGILSKGAISIQDTNDLPINDRRILLTTLQKAEDEKAKRMEELRNMKPAKSNRRF